MEDWKKVREIVRKTFDVIADSWTHLRARPVKEVLYFLQFVRKGKVLDLGCGNGRNLVPFLEIGVKGFGVDFSSKMIREAKRFLEKHQVKAYLVIADFLHLPFKDSLFDYSIFTRSLHHLPTKKLRIRALEEVRRVTRRNGKILLSVWRRYYPRFIFDFFSSLFEKKFGFGDVYKKWRYHGVVYKRFYHLYSKKEILEELREAKLNVKVFFRDDGNFVSILEP